MERLFFLRPFLEKYSRNSTRFNAEMRLNEPEECPAPIQAECSRIQDKQLKIIIRNAIKDTKYKDLLKLLEKFRLKYKKQRSGIECRVIDLMETYVETCTPYERTIFLRWYYTLLRRRMRYAIIKESLNYRIYQTKVERKKRNNAFYHLLFAVNEMKLHLKIKKSQYSSQIVSFIRIFLVCFEFSIPEIHFFVSFIHRQQVIYRKLIRVQRPFQHFVKLSCRRLSHSIDNIPPFCSASDWVNCEIGNWCPLNTRNSEQFVHYFLV